MKVQLLENGRLNEFVAYCKKHKNEIDDSYLCDEDLIIFEANDENPTYIITNNQDRIIATASLSIDDYNRMGKKARFRIFHSEVEDIECFNMLMKAIVKHTTDLEKLFIFIPIVNKELIRFMEELNFTVERYSYLLVREDKEVPAVTLPMDYVIKVFEPGIDEEVWCEVRNTAFAKLQGSETPITPAMVAKFISESDYLEGGLLILYHNDKPVGIVRGSADDYEGAAIMNIGPLAIIPEYQEKGLGRSLLRTSLDFAKNKGYERTILCVNAENERAKALYIQEGFEQVEAVVCYKYDLTNETVAV